MGDAYLLNNFVISCEEYNIKHKGKTIAFPL